MSEQLNDVDMEDLNPLAKALPEETPRRAPENEADDDAALKLQLELTRNMFMDQEVELKHLKQPLQCLEYPDQAEAIATSYLENTTFTVKVWLNFDESEGVFFEGARAEACGKLQLPAKKYKELASIDPTVLKFQYVNFHIGTPFRLLAEMRFDIDHSQSSPRLIISGDFVSDNERLQRYIEYCAKRIERMGLAHGTDGLVLQDLEDFAELFRRDRKQAPGREDGWEQPAFGGGEWVGVEEPAHDYSGWTRSSY